jgi:hypothetical protein
MTQTKFLSLDSRFPVRDSNQVHTAYKSENFSTEIIFIYGLFNDGVSVSFYIARNCRMTTECLIVKDMERCSIVSFEMLSQNLSRWSEENYG